MSGAQRCSGLIDSKLSKLAAMLINSIDQQFAIDQLMARPRIPEPSTCHELFASWSVNNDCLRI